MPPLKETLQCQCFSCSPAVLFKQMVKQYYLACDVVLDSFLAICVLDFVFKKSSIPGDVCVLKETTALSLEFQVDDNVKFGNYTTMNYSQPRESLKMLTEACKMDTTYQYCWDVGFKQVRR